MKESGEFPSQPIEKEISGDRSPHTPHLPEWFKKRQSENYRTVLSEELDELTHNPDTYLNSIKFDSGQHDEEGRPIFMSWQEAQKKCGIETGEITRLAQEMFRSVSTGLNLETLGENAQTLLQEIKAPSDQVRQDFQEIIQTLTRRIHTTILRRLIREYVPQRQAILQRASYEIRGEQVLGQKEGLVQRLNKLGGAGLLLKFILRKPTFRIEEARNNIEEGIGGIEFDVRTDTDGNPILTHATRKSEVLSAPKLEELLSLLRELLPTDPHAPRQARRGLKLFLHLKTHTPDSGEVERVLRLLDQYDLTSQTYIMTSRPEILYAADDADNKIKRERPDHQLVKFAFQSLPLSKIGGLISIIGPWLKKLGISDRYDDDGNLRSLASWTEEHALFDSWTILSQWPPKGKVMEILKKHRGSALGVPAAVYDKSMLEQTQTEGIKIHLGMIDKKDILPSLLEPDEYGTRPRTFMTMSRDTVYPKGAEKTENKR